MYFILLSNVLLPYKTRDMYNSRKPPTLTRDREIDYSGSLFALKIRYEAVLKSGRLVANTQGVRTVGKC